MIRTKVEIDDGKIKITFSGTADSMVFTIDQEQALALVAELKSKVREIRKKVK
jgi:hypothetical protein